jgi:hypothetical protein
MRARRLPGQLRLHSFSSIPRGDTLSTSIRLQNIFPGQSAALIPRFILLQQDIN